MKFEYNNCLLAHEVGVILSVMARLRPVFVNVDGDELLIAVRQTIYMEQQIHNFTA